MYTHFEITYRYKLKKNLIVLTLMIHISTTEAMQYQLNVGCKMQDRYRLAHNVKPFGQVSVDPGNTLHNKVSQPNNYRLKRGTFLLTQASRAIDTCTIIILDCETRGNLEQHLELR